MESLSTALIGGSFDPFHNGHLHIARQILGFPGFGHVIFLPNEKHNFKKDRVSLAFSERYRLIQKAIEPFKNMEVWDLDSGEGNTGYTADLLKKIHAFYPKICYHFVIGADNLSALKKWYDFEWLKQNVSFLILPRPDYEIDTSHLRGIRYQVLPIQVSDISSTQIKHRLQSRQSIHGLVPELIEEEVIRLYSS